MEIKELEAYLQRGGLTQTKSGKHIFVFRINRDTGIARVMYHPSRQLRDIPVQNIVRKS